MIAVSQMSFVLWLYFFLFWFCPNVAKFPICFSKCIDPAHLEFCVPHPYSPQTSIQGLIFHQQFLQRCEGDKDHLSPVLMERYYFLLGGILPNKL